MPAPGSRQTQEGGGKPTASGPRERRAASEVTDQALELCPSSSNNTWSSKICLFYRSLHKVRWKHVGDAFVLSHLAPHRPSLSGTYWQEPLNNSGRSHPRFCDCPFPIPITPTIKLCLCPHLNWEEPVLGTPLEAHSSHSILNSPCFTLLIPACFVCVA